MRLELHGECASSKDKCRTTYFNAGANLTFR